MKQINKKHNILFQIEKYIEEGYHIVLIDSDTLEPTKFDSFINYVKRKQKKKYIVGYVSKGVEQFTMKEEDTGKVLLLTETEYSAVEKIYSMYEFSDKICFWTGADRFPSLLSYLDTGILTEEEVFDALLE